MRVLLLLLLIFLVGCQELPKKYRGEEGRKLLEKYKYQFVEGVVELDEGLIAKLPQKPFFLIISVRDKENPMPIAVLRVRDPEFPYKFKITGKHKLRNDRMIEGELIITARVSKSPKAEREKGDLIGMAEGRAGDRGIRIKLAEVVQ